MLLCGYNIPFDVVIKILVLVDVFGYGSFLRTCKRARDYFKSNQNVHYRILFLTSRRLLRWEHGPRYMTLKYQDPNFYDTWLKLGSRHENKEVPILQIVSDILRDKIIHYKKSLHLSSCFSDDNLEQYKLRADKDFSFDTKISIKYKNIKLLTYIVSEIPVVLPLDDDFFTDKCFLPVVKILVEKYPEHVKSIYDNCIERGFIFSWDVTILEYLWSTNIVQRFVFDSKLNTSSKTTCLSYILDNDLLVLSDRNILCLTHYLFNSARRLKIQEIRSIDRAVNIAKIKSSAFGGVDSGNRSFISSLCIKHFKGIYERTIDYLEEAYPIFIRYLKNNELSDDLELTLLEELDIKDEELFILIFCNVANYEKKELEKYKSRINSIVLIKYTKFLDTLFLRLIDTRSKSIIDILLSSKEIQTIMREKKKTIVVSDTKYGSCLRMMYMCKYIDYKKLWEYHDLFLVDKLGDGEVGRIFMYKLYYVRLMCSILHLLPKVTRKGIDRNKLYYSEDSFVDIPDISPEINSLLRRSHTLFCVVRSRSIENENLTRKELVTGINKFRVIFAEVEKLKEIIEP